MHVSQTTSNSYTCACCGGVFDKSTGDWSDECAEAELIERFGKEALNEPLEIVCDDCYRAIMEDD